MSQQKWPFAFTGVTVVIGMLYLLFWNKCVNHVNMWATGGDVWGIWRAAHYVGWGDPGGIYAPGNGVVTLPGMPVLLAPAAMLSGQLHLAESVLPFVLPRPTAALLLQPIELLLGSTVIFASNSLSKRLGVNKSRRIWLGCAVTIVAWPVTAVWGHAEDLLALTFAIYAIIAALSGRWAKSGWLFGFGICIQPLVGLIIPVLVGAAPTGRRIQFVIRSGLMSATLVGIAYINDPSNTLRALLKQPTPPSLNHATPWVWLAPHLPSLPSLSTSASRVGGRLFPEITSPPGSNVIVAAGPGRLVYLLLSIALGFLVWKWAPNAFQIVWMSAAVLAMRCFFEAVMTPYYLAPPLILTMVIASTQCKRRFWATVILSVELVVVAYDRLGPWAWWLPVVTGVAVVLALALPGGDAPASRLNVSLGEVLPSPV